MQSEEPVNVLSSAVYGGGLGHARSFVNWKVPLSYSGSDPAQDLGEQAEAGAIHLNGRLV